MKTPVGPLRLRVEDGALVEMSIGDPSEDAVPPWVREPLERYFDGELDALEEIPIRLDGAGFKRGVWEALRRIPAGKTMTYGQLAADAGNPRAARAAGTVCGQNPIWLVVPCHRALRSGGGLGGYAGGLDIKRWLLRHEGVLLS